MAKDDENIIIIMDGTGGMEWKLPKSGNIQRKQAYALLGMAEYTKVALVKLLDVPEKITENKK